MRLNGRRIQHFEWRKIMVRLAMLFLCLVITGLGGCSKREKKEESGEDQVRAFMKKELDAWIAGRASKGIVAPMHGSHSLYGYEVLTIVPGEKVEQGVAKTLFGESDTGFEEGDAVYSVTVILKFGTEGGSERIEKHAYYVIAKKNGKMLVKHWVQK